MSQNTSIHQSIINLVIKYKINKILDGSNFLVVTLTMPAKVIDHFFYYLPQLNHELNIGNDEHKFYVNKHNLQK